jgi:hypothetical protein
MEVSLVTGLYATVWIALVLYTAAEIARVRLRDHRWALNRARSVSAAGAVLMIVHALLAFAVRYNWDHELAVEETSRQAAAVYGFEWRGNIFVSYAFLAVWIADLWCWRTPPSRPSHVTWIGRAFFLVMIVNGAVVFARPSWRIAGSVLVGALVWAWWPSRPAPRSTVAVR